MDNLERKFGRYAISNLTMILLGINAVGYALYYLIDVRLYMWLSLNPYLILRGQVWRLFTWLVVPGESLLSFVIGAFLFFMPIGRQMERVWGDFKYNLYLFGAVIFTDIGMFLLYFYFVATTGGAEAVSSITMASIGITPYYVMLSVLFAYAATFPESQVLFMFLIPLKIKVLGIVYAVFMGLKLLTGFLPSSMLTVFYRMGIYPYIVSTTPERVVILATIVNFALFWLWSRSSSLARFKPKEIKRRREFREAVKPPHMKGGTRHRCAVCGATEMTHPDYEFRVCSKCAGDREYCQEHLFTHQHIRY